MYPATYGAFYKTPEGNQPPDETDLASNTQYPNLNSRDYARRPLNHLLRMHPAWECITLNEKNNAIIATNKLSGREWNGSLWGFEELDNVSAENADFKLQCKSIISKLQFISRNIFLVAFRSGNLQVWSTRSEMRNLGGNPYCLFLIGEKCEHVKPIVCMDVMKTDASKAATGSIDGTLKIWDMGSADLFSIHTFRFAHTDAITSVESSCKDQSIYATCSLDKSALLWDDRLTRPAIAIYENHNVRFKNLTWANTKIGDNLIYLGDESGYVHTADVRLPNNFVHSTKCFNRSLRKILPKGKYLALISDSNIVKITEVTAVDHTIYENANSQDFVRDAIWLDSTELITVGFDGKLRNHKIE